jgi:hypothetical protein
MANPGQQLQSLKIIVEGHFATLHDTLVLQQGHDDWFIHLVFSKYVSHDQKSFELEILERRFVLIVEHAPTAGFSKLRTYERVMSLQKYPETELHHLADLEIGIFLYGYALFLNEPYKKQIQLLNRIYIETLFTFIRTRELIAYTELENRLKDKG